MSMKILIPCSHFYWIACMLVHNFRSFPGEIQNWPPYKKGKERPQKEADYSRLVDGTFNKQGNLHRRLAFGG